MADDARSLREYVDVQFNAVCREIAALSRHTTDLAIERDRRIEQRFKDQQTAVEAALAAARTAVGAALTSAKEAVDKANTASEKRFESVNEFRATLADQQRSLMPRSEAELRFKALEESVGKLTSTDVRTAGAKSGSRDVWAWIVGVAGLVALLWGLFGR